MTEVTKSWIEWVERLDIPQVLTTELQESILDEGLNHIETLEKKIQTAIYVLNNIPDTPNVGKNGESSYEIIKQLENEESDNA